MRDFYDINDPAKYYDDPEAKDWLKNQDELARITEEATGEPRDLCLYNSDKDTFDKMQGMKIDFVDDGQQQGFVIQSENPTPPAGGCDCSSGSCG